MDGKRIQEYLSKEAKALLTVYRQFQTLLPADNEDAASHKGEDGRYIESLIIPRKQKRITALLKEVMNFQKAFFIRNSSVKLHKS